MNPSILLLAAALLLQAATPTATTAVFSETSSIAAETPTDTARPAPLSSAIPGSSATPLAPAATAAAAAATPPAPVAAAGPVAIPPSAATADATADPDSLARAYRRTGVAPTVDLAGSGRGAATLVPFGHAKPILRCAPLRACAIELEPGELVLATSLGDAERWLVQSAATGAGAHTPLLVVKPTACDLTTNLLVSTDRRVYELALDSPPCRNLDGAAAGESGYNPQLPYTGLIRFYYPDDLVRRWSDQEAQAQADDAARAAGRTPLAPAVRLSQLNFAYTWDRSRRWPWVPLQVFDDGEHTFIVLPPTARHAELPVLLAVEPGGALSLLTYHLESDTLVADHVLDHAVLLAGHGRPRDQQRLDIVNRAAPPPSRPRPTALPTADTAAPHLTER